MEQHDTSEHASSAPSTPTTSVTSISDVTSTLEGTSTDAEEGVEGPAPNRHPSWFFREEPLVTICIEDVNFRIPRFFLTRDSEYFARELGKQDGSYRLRVVISDPDVTTVAFDCLLQLIYPRVYGTAPDFNLAQWTGVLHLADKWGFDYLRNVAVKAILPLSSCVDKIVISQKYGLEDGLAGAFADLLARDADLSLEEGTALGLPAVIAIAGGRARARQNGSILSRQTIERLVEEIFMPRRSILETSSVLFNVDPARIVEKQANALQPDSLSVPDATTGDSISASHQRSLDRWANFAVLHGTAGRELLIKHLNDHKSHGKYAVNAVLSSFWDAYEMHWKAEIASYDPLTYPEHTLTALRMLKLNMLAPEFNEAIKSFCLGAINQWISLSEIMSCSPTFSEMSNYYRPGGGEIFFIPNFWQDFCSAVPDQLFNLATTIRCTRYIIDSDVIENHTLSKALFAGLWIKLRNTFDQLWTLDKQSAGTKLQSLMALFGHSAFTNVACKEMDDFYLQAHDAIQTEPQTESSSVKGLQRLINMRVWPKDCGSS